MRRPKIFAAIPAVLERGRWGRRVQCSPGSGADGRATEDPDAAEQSSGDN
jgi:hypothetical protein